MNKEEFGILFARVLEAAAAHAEAELKRPVPRDFDVELHGAGHSRSSLTLDESVTALYLGQDLFYRIIDVAVIRVHARRTTAFVRASGHMADTFEQTWNQPPGNGPFKLLLADKISTDDDVHSGREVKND